MSRIKEYTAARFALESAVGNLISVARNFKGDGTGGSTHRELLAAGREYGRAMNRLERVRR